MRVSATCAVELRDNAKATDLYGEPKYIAKNEIHITTVAYIVKPEVIIHMIQSELPAEAMS